MLQPLLQPLLQLLHSCYDGAHTGATVPVHSQMHTSNYGGHGASCRSHTYVQARRMTTTTARDFCFGCLGHMGCVSPCRDAWLSLPLPRSGGGGHILGMKPTKMTTTTTPTDPNIPLEGPLGPTSKKCHSRENRASGGGGHSRGPYCVMLLSSSRKQAHNRRVINYI